ncbi:unnamed protein product [Merluccius merluccius]
MQKLANPLLLDKSIHMSSLIMIFQGILPMSFLKGWRQVPFLTLSQASIWAHLSRGLGPGPDPPPCQSPVTPEYGRSKTPAAPTTSAAAPRAKLPSLFLRLLLTRTRVSKAGREEKKKKKKGPREVTPGSPEPQWRRRPLQAAGPARRFVETGRMWALVAASLSLFWVCTTTGRLGGGDTS